MRRKILVIADSLNEAEMLHGALARDAAAIWYAAESTRGIQLFMDERPDLLVLSLPAVDDALDFLVALHRADQFIAALPYRVLMLSCDAEEQRAQAQCADGVFDAVLPRRQAFESDALRVAVWQAEAVQRLMSARKNDLGHPLSAPILVVEDDDEYRDILQQSLSCVGYPVICARDGFHALSLLRHVRPSLIVLDAEMPRLDGPAVIARMRNNDALADVPVIALAGTSEPEAVDAWRGAVRVSGNPFDREALLNSVEECLSRAGGETGIGTGPPPGFDAPLHWHECRINKKGSML